MPSTHPEPSDSCPPVRLRVLRFAAGCLLTACIAAGSAPAQLPNEELIKKMLLAGETTRAIEAAKQVIAANPKQAEGHVLVANALLQRALYATQSRPPRPDGSRAPIDSSEA